MFGLATRRGKRLYSVRIYMVIAVSGRRARAYIYAHRAQRVNRRSALQHVECGNAFEVCIGKMFNFYPELPHVCMIVEFHYHDGRHILAFTMVTFHACLVVRVLRSTA